MERDSMIRYGSWDEAIEILPDEKQQLNAYKFIKNYGLHGIEADPSVDVVAYAIYLMAKPQIDANNQRFVNGQKGGRPKVDWENLKKPMVTENPKNQKPNVNVNVNENVNGNVDVNVNANENEKNKKKEEKEKQKKINKKVEYSDDFESFWKAYPKKKGKQKAREAWENAIKGGNDPKHLINKAGEYATEIKLKRVEDHYIKFAQGWLNDGRFDDDYFTGNNGEKPDLDVLY